MKAALQSLGCTLLVLGCLIKLWTLFTTTTSTTIRDLNWKDVNFLHTTDTHGWYSGHLNQKQYSGDWGDFISFASHMKTIAEENGKDLLLVDSGDRHDGNGLSDITTPNGIKSTPIFIKSDYDILTIGNHELYVWENSKQELETIVEHFPDNYVCSNVEFKLENGSYIPFGKRHLYFETKVQKKKILAFGFLFDFKRANAGTKVTPIKSIVDHSEWFNETLHSYSEEDIDMIVIAAHTPIDPDWYELNYLHSHLRKFYPNVVVQYFGGHSHIRDFRVFDAKAAALQSGRYCETVGFMGVQFTDSLNPRDAFSRLYIDFNRKSFVHHTNTTAETFDTEKGKDVTKLIHRTRKELALNKPIGHVSNNYYVDFVPVTHERSIFNFLTKRVLQTLEPTNFTATNERIIIINTGSIRYDLYKGPYTIDSMYIVSPFENAWSSVRVPKSIAAKVTRKLNENGYILGTESLLPPHHQTSKKLQKRQTVFQYPIIQDPTDETPNSLPKLSKGYVTQDDFGNDGDDTPHRAVIHFDVPSVVESVQFSNSDEVDVDLVFYEFITPNVLTALKQLGYEVSTSDVKLYTTKTMGSLLNDYVKNEDV